MEQSGAGKEGITNYTHMLTSGHIKNFMEAHRNLYTYSLQGWENLNEKFKLTFFNHTQHGGNFGANKAETLCFYFKPICIAFQ